MPLADLDTLLDQVMLTDAPALQRRRDELLTAKITSGQRFDQLVADAQRSAKRAEARRSLIPEPRFDPGLPVTARRDEIAQAINTHQVVVLCGETGSGKTTQLPKICLGLGRGVRGQIAHTQPRRLAARSVALRIAQELGVDLGKQVGFKVRFSDNTSPETAVALMTDGVLLAEAAGGDPDLRKYDTIIIDEAHERSLNIDFLLGYLKRILPRRPDLKLIITSATIDPARFSDHFGGPSVAPVIMVSGRTFPVEVRYQDIALDEETLDQVETNAVVDAAHELCSHKLPIGDILVFLPGEREIRQVESALRQQGPAACDILPLYSRLTEQEQDRVFAISPPDRRKIVLATNVAETSLTVPGIRYVIDTGLVRIARYDPHKKVERLPIELVSRASADQRSGRCGRVAAGVCIRLYPEQLLKKQPLFTDPEIRRTDLSAVILRTKALGLGPITDFPFIDPPDAGAIRDGCETLFELGALSTPHPDGEITPIGKRLADLPTDPRIGRMLLAGEQFNCLAEILVLAAASEIQDPLQRPLGREQMADAAHGAFRSEKSDFLTLLNLWRLFDEEVRQRRESGAASWCRDQYVSFARLREWGDIIQHLRQAARESGLGPPGGADLADVGVASPDSVHKALLAGLITSACCRDDVAASFEYRGIRGNRCFIFPGSALFKKRPKWFVAAEIIQTSKLYARTLGPIEPEWIEEAAPHMLTRHVEGPHLDAATGEPSCFERLTLAGLTIAPRRRALLASADPAAARQLIIAKLLVENDYPEHARFKTHNAGVLARADEARARLRSATPMLDAAAAAAFFDRLLPQEITSRAALDRWRTGVESAHPQVLYLDSQTALRTEALRAFDDSLWPSQLTIAGETCPVLYRLAPGKETDGVTLRVPLLALPMLDDHRPEWGVPGWLPDKIAALIKQLPRQHRAAVEALAPRGTAPSEVPQRVANDLAGLVTFGQGPLPAALSEALAIAYDIIVPVEAWPMSAIPDHLTLRVEVIDAADHTSTEDSARNDQGHTSAHEPTILAAGRDLVALKQRLAPRIARAQAAAAKTRFARSGLTSWNFGDLPARVQREADSDSPGAEIFDYPTLLDDRTSVALTLMQKAVLADAQTRLGIRRLFVLAAKDELSHRLSSISGLDELERWFTSAGGLGSVADLHDALMCITAERVFMLGQAQIRTQADFDERREACWGRLGQVIIETAAFMAKLLEPRFIVAKRLSGGTNRLWAASIADIREHAAYLMPPGFLHALPWERLQRYPLYAQAMRQRLLNLREDGSGAETQALAVILPYHKRFTAAIAHAMAAQRDAHQAAGEAASVGGGGSAGEAKSGRAAPRAVPASKRAAPTVNLDAGLWAMQPGHATTTLDAFRWAIEDLRVAFFAPELLGSPAAIERAKDRMRLDELAAKVDR